MSDQLFDQAVRDWLEDGSDRTPPAAMDAVLLAVKTTPQERDLRIPRRFNLMPTYMRLAAGLAIVAVLGVAALTLVKPTPGPGTSPSPTATLSPTASAGAVADTDPPPAAASTNLDTTTWTAFTSTRYGYSAAYPRGWFVSVATQDWGFETREAFWSSAGEGADRFVSGGTVFHMTAFASTMTAQGAEGAWITAYEGSGPECPLPGDLPVIEIDGHQGWISTNCAMAKADPQPSPVVEAFVAVGQTMFVFSIDDYDDALLRTFLTTVKLPAA